MQDLQAQAALCKQATYSLSSTSSEDKNNALSAIAQGIEQRIDDILDANQRDIQRAIDNQKAASFIDRLTLNKARIQDIIEGLHQVIQLSDPCGRILREWKEHDLHFVKKSVPMGVIGIIYEARPNVSVDAASLCLKSGNVCFLRGSKDAIETNKALVSIMQEALLQVGFDKHCIALMEDTSRAGAQAFMKLNKYMDLLIPRGSAKLIQACVENASVPLIETGSGNCHIYVDKDADVAGAIDVIINAKCQRVSVCNSCESILLHSNMVDIVGPTLLEALAQHNVIVHGDERIAALDTRVLLASEEDYATEYLNYEVSIHVVDSLAQAITHINTYHTMHSDVILSPHPERIETFMNAVDSAVVYANASTRFSDGQEFGFGAEIGISTQKMHARGPMGLAELTTYKYQVYGHYTTRK